MAARPKPWSRAARVAESLDAPASLDAPWYRVAPIGVREVADVFSLELDGGVPSAERPRIDRKLVPPYALIDVGHPRALLCSRAFAAGLLRAGVGGWSCSRADHLTARPVEGYACAWLEVRSVAGRMVRSEISASPGAVRAGLFLGGTPVAPVTIDLSTGTGHELAWTTEWIGAETSAWRALIASRRLVAALFDALAEAGDERWFAVEPVATTGSSTPEPQVGPPPATPDAPTRAPAKAAAILSELEERAERDGHDLGARSRSDVGRWPSSDLETTLREHEGLRLHGGALELFPTRGRCSLANATDAARRLGAEPREGERVFAVSPGLGVFWAVTPEGTVRGLARTGLRYGPGAPFAQWLRDLAADLDEAVAQPDRPWAASLLGR